MMRRIVRPTSFAWILVVASGCEAIVPIEQRMPQPESYDMSLPKDTAGHEAAWIAGFRDGRQGDRGVVPRAWSDQERSHYSLGYHVGSSSVIAWHDPTETRYAFGAKVRITNGFFAGCEGFVLHWSTLGYVVDLEGIVITNKGATHRPPTLCGVDDADLEAVEVTARVSYG